jgi:hypothetical protein
MSQISPPLRILIIGSVVFLAAWFAFLRPGGGTSSTSTPAAATPQPLSQNANGPAAKTSLGRAVQAAHRAANASDAQTAADSGAAAPSTSAPAAAHPATAAGKPAAPAAAAKPAHSAAAAAALPLPVAKALAEDKILVMLFWNPKAADDRAVRQALRHVDTYRHRVVIRVANIRDVARYAPITQGVDVSQSPSVVVVGHHHEADLMSGYVDRMTIEQSISNAIHAQG